MPRALVGFVVVAALCASAAATADATTPTIDEAFPPAVAVGTRGGLVAVQRVAITTRDGVVWLRLELGPAPRRRWRRGGADDIVDLDVPAGTRLLGMAIASEDRTVWAMPVRARRAVELFRDGASQAVVTAHGASAGVDHFELAVHVPAPPAIELAVQLPGQTQVAVRAPPKVPVTIDGQATTTLALAPGDPTTARFVDARTALAFAPMADPLPFPDSSGGPRMLRALDKSIIRRQIRFHTNQLAQCYMAVAQWAPSVRGGVVLHFAIDRLGAVSEVAVDGELQHPAVRDCLAREVASWAFPESDEGIVIVNYPIEFGHVPQ